MRKKRPPTVLLWADLVEATDLVARRFGIAGRVSLLPLKRSTTTTLDGDAVKDPKVVRLRLHRYRRPNTPFGAGTIFSTLAHELAHLIPGGWDHGPKHRELAVAVARFLRESGYSVAPQLFANTAKPRRRRA